MPSHLSSMRSLLHSFPIAADRLQTQPQREPRVRLRHAARSHLPWSSLHAAGPPLRLPIGKTTVSARLRGRELRSVIREVSSLLSHLSLFFRCSFVRNSEQKETAEHFMAVIAPRVQHFRQMAAGYQFTPSSQPAVVPSAPSSNESTRQHHPSSAAAAAAAAAAAGLQENPAVAAANQPFTPAVPAALVIGSTAHHPSLRIPPSSSLSSSTWSSESLGSSSSSNGGSSASAPNVSIESEHGDGHPHDDGPGLDGGGGHEADYSPASAQPLPSPTSDQTLALENLLGVASSAAPSVPIFCLEPSYKKSSLYDELQPVDMEALGPDADHGCLPLHPNLLKLIARGQSPIVLIRLPPRWRTQDQLVSDVFLDLRSLMESRLDCFQSHLCPLSLGDQDQKYFDSKSKLWQTWKRQDQTPVDKSATRLAINLTTRPLSEAAFMQLLLAGTSWRLHAKDLERMYYSAARSQEVRPDSLIQLICPVWTNARRRTSLVLPPIMDAVTTRIQQDSHDHDACNRMLTFDRQGKQACVKNDPARHKWWLFEASCFHPCNLNLLSPHPDNLLAVLQIYSAITVKCHKCGRSHNWNLENFDFSG